MLKRTLFERTVFERTVFERTVFLLALLLLPLSLHAAPAALPLPDGPKPLVVHSHYAVLVDAVTGKVLWQRNAEKPAGDCVHDKDTDCHSAFRARASRRRSDRAEWSPVPAGQQPASEARGKDYAPRSAVRHAAALCQ